jgi:hypothetical protein
MNIDNTTGYFSIVEVNDNPHPFCDWELCCAIGKQTINGQSNGNISKHTAIPHPMLP